MPERSVHKLVGVGGGFLLVPALLTFAGLETRRAVGVSLAVIAINSAAGLAGHVSASFDQAHSQVRFFV